jgi:hypothetical protein
MEYIIKSKTGELLVKYEITKINEDQAEIIFYNRENYSTGPEWYKMKTIYLPKRVLELGLKVLKEKQKSKIEYHIDD